MGSNEKVDVESIAYLRQEAQSKRWAEQAKRNSDGWQNVITGIGRSRDKRTGGQVISPAPNSSFREFEDLYHADDIAATMANLPSAEMVRNWVTMRVDDSTSPSDDAIRTENVNDDLENRLSVSKRMDQKVQELGVQAVLFEAMVWARVFGGSLLFLGADDGLDGDPGQLEKPLREDQIESIKFLRVFDRWDVWIQSANTDMTSAHFGEPELYSIRPQTIQGGALGTQAAPHTGLVHASRFIRFDGSLTTRRRMIENNGWADSIYTRTAEVLRDYGMAWAGVSHLISDFAQAVFKMKGLRAALASDQEGLIIDRLIQMDLARSLARAVPLDVDEGEEFERKTTPVSGLPELMDRFALRVSTAARMPVSLLLGQSPAGLNATGDSDISFFYDQIKAQQETMLRPKLERLFHLLFLAKDGPTEGVEPENWSFVFNPLWQLDAQEEAQLRKTQAEADEIYIMNQVVTPNEVALSRFGGDAYSPDTTLDTETRAQEGDDAAARTDAKHLKDQGSEHLEGICDPDSPNYDPEECARRQRSDNSGRVLATSTDGAHAHFAKVDISGNGVTSFALSSGGVSHEHLVRDWVVIEAAGHTHTIDRPEDL